MKDQFVNEIINDYTSYARLHRKFYGYAIDYFKQYIDNKGEWLSFLDVRFTDNYVIIYYKDVVTEDTHETRKSIQDFANFIMNKYDEEKYYN